MFSQVGEGRGHGSGGRLPHCVVAAQDAPKAPHPSRESGRHELAEKPGPVAEERGTSEGPILSPGRRDPGLQADHRHVLQARYRWEQCDQHGRDVGAVPGEWPVNDQRGSRRDVLHRQEDQRRRVAQKERSKASLRAQETLRADHR